MSRKTWTQVLLFAVGCGAGAVLLAALQQAVYARCAGPYGLVNTDALCAKDDVIRKTSYTDTKNDIQNLIDDAHAHGVITASVYFRDLVHGPVFGINETTDFAPASLLKLPIAFVFMNGEELQPGVLDSKIIYEGTSSVDIQRVQPEESAQEGQ
ncbi:MAG TPA: serine hydrolase, partial [Vicinamibacterales bacterium]|nr:serine hydrolase [Vicinamibacterales bacterium]